MWGARDHLTEETSRFILIYGVRRVVARQIPRPDRHSQVEGASL
jgi:hypothetical protein